MGTLGKHWKLSEKTKKRQSEAQKKIKHKPFSDERKSKISKIAKEKGFGKWMKGKKLSNETKQKIKKALADPELKKKISEKLKGKIPWNKGLKGVMPEPWNKGLEISEETKKKISEANKGYKHTEEAKEKIRIASSNRKHSEETKKKIGDLKRGDKCHFWKGGISNYPYPEDWTETLRESIRQRYDYTCQECGIHQDELTSRAKKLDIHHIDYNKENCNPENLISLCRSCHIKTNSNREYWIEYFNN